MQISVRRRAEGLNNRSARERERETEREKERERDA